MKKILLWALIGTYPLYGMENDIPPLPRQEWTIKKTFKHDAEIKSVTFIEEKNTLIISGYGQQYTDIYDTKTMQKTRIDHIAQWETAIDPTGNHIMYSPHEGNVVVLNTGSKARVSLQTSHNISENQSLIKMVLNVRHPIGKAILQYAILMAKQSVPLMLVLA